jgi:hypothetical protein
MKPAIAGRLGLAAWAVVGLAATSMLSACGQAPTAPPPGIQASQPPEAAAAKTPAEATAAKPAEAAPLKSAEATAVTLPGKTLEAPAPPLTDGVYPCSFCHNADLKPNPVRRELVQMHGDLVLVHDAPGRLWCVDCHDITDYDSLHLSSGEKVPFDQAYRLCGQCHGRNIRDWAAGVHGRRTGQWNGDKAYLLCANCHSAHVPLFKSLAPMPAPAPPTRAAK